MSIKKSREEVAYNYLKECGPCLITYPKDEKVKILLSSDGEVFWLNDDQGPNVPHIKLEEIYEEAKHLLLDLFTADMKNEISLDEIYGLENILRAELAVCLNEGDLNETEVREIKIKFMDVKEGIVSIPSEKEVKVAKKDTKPVEVKPEPVVETKVADVNGDNLDDDENPFAEQ